MEQMDLDKVVFVPAAQAPLKPGSVRAADEHRLAMLRCALEGVARVEVSEVEILRGGTSFTIDTARYFRQIYPHDQLFWIIGSDQLGRLALWNRVDDLVRMLEFICLERPGETPVQQPGIKGLKLHRCRGHLMQISSTEIRERVARELPLHCLMPNKAIEYLRENNLYRA